MKLYCVLCKAFTDHTLEIASGEAHCICSNMRHGEKPVEYEYPIFTPAEETMAKQETERLRVMYGDGVARVFEDEVEPEIKHALHVVREKAGVPRAELYEKRPSTEDFSKRCGHTVKFPRVPQEELVKLFEEHNRVNQPPTLPDQLSVGIRYNEPDERDSKTARD